MSRLQLHAPSWCKNLSALSRRMFSTSSPQSADHVTRTQSSTRKELISSATVLDIRNESDNVKVLTLRVHDRNLSFKPGQWVDTFIPGMETIAGYSMCSSPFLLESEGILILAVKFSEHPPAFWVHTKCRAGDVLRLRAGGDYYFDPQPGEENPGDVLLVAGGVGINPLYSMLNHVAHINTLPQGPYRGNVLLLFSARTFSELIFRKELENLSAAHSNIATRFFVSRESSVPASVKVGRIMCEDIQKAVQELRTERLKVFLCGPSPMIEDIEQFCVSCNVRKEQLNYERWW
ncbi:oxidoreductase NAD-binding domain-containing protein 1-like isoform X2 [Babylonia areolata]|uniref:oxidoreductase NAD-binding domain-containing protein 1-like isoform X2 n=1 Tax=Babylonia areolata TaxID=304850 RepID=UPI003FD386CB